jgi:hypothetical protein
MERANETGMLSGAELDNVTGGLLTGLGTVADRRTLLTARLSEIFKNNNPPSFGPIHLLDR